MTIEAKKGYPVTYFDLDELKAEELPDSHLQRLTQPSVQDKIHKFYLTQLRGRKDFNYLSRAIRPQSELLVVGTVAFN